MWVSLSVPSAIASVLVVYAIYVAPRFVWPLVYWERRGIPLTDPNIVFRRMLGIFAMTALLPPLFLYTFSTSDAPALSVLFSAHAGTAGPSLLAWLGLSAYGGGVGSFVLYHSLAVAAAVALVLLMLAGPLFAIAVEAALTQFPPESNANTSSSASSNGSGRGVGDDGTPRFLPAVAPRAASLSAALPSLQRWAASVWRGYSARGGLLAVFRQHCAEFFGPATIAAAWRAALPGMRAELRDELPWLLRSWLSGSKAGNKAESKSDDNKTSVTDSRGGISISNHSSRSESGQSGQSGESVVARFGDEASWRVPNPVRPCTLNNARAVIASVTEEVLMRALACSLLRAAGLSRGWTLALSSLLFGLIHIPGHYPLMARAVRPPLARVLLRALPQVAYTAVFGAVAGAFLLRTGSLAAPVAAHVLCNWAARALPEPGFMHADSAAWGLRRALWCGCALGVAACVAAFPWIANADFFAPEI